MVARGTLSVPVIGVARAGYKREEFEEYIRDSLEQSRAGLDAAAFAKRRGSFCTSTATTPARTRRSRSCARRSGAAAYPLHHPAVPPSLSRRCWRSCANPVADGERVAPSELVSCCDLEVRAPSSTPRCTARSPSRRIPGIDHYLGKESVQNLLFFRFLTCSWSRSVNRNYVERVEITMAEAFGVETRGKFYEEVGVIRDVVQNHLLQVVAQLAMEPPRRT